MVDSFVSAPGDLITIEQLKIPKAKDVALLLQTLPYVSLLECRWLSVSMEAEVVVFETEVELGQRIVNDIHPIERIAVVFFAEDITAPEVLALREDFPKVPHLNLREYEIPRSICLYDEAYDELKLRWTAIRFIERIREWLALTAKGKLHGQEQPLEPLLMESVGEIVIPFDLFSYKDSITPELLAIHLVNGTNNKIFLIAQRKEITSFQEQNLTYVATAIRCAPQQHGIIHKQPKNLYELHQFLYTVGIDLLKELRERLKIWQNTRPHKDILDAKLALVIDLPKKREESSMPEVIDVWAFLSTKTVKEIGEEIGIWGFHEGNVATLILIDEKKKGQEVDIHLLKPMFSFSRELAASLCGFSNSDKKKITAIGLGALGSQVFMNLVRMGYGTWTLIDEDRLFPHNLSRHALDGFAVGYSKVQALAYLANETIDGDMIANPVVANVLRPERAIDVVNKNLNGTEVILDFSTSIAVARYLARDIDSKARRITLFLNPTGTDLVMLAEDSNREVSLDYLEMQYYRHIINATGFEQHLQRNDKHIIYANSCRDTSNTIPQDLVALHAAICSRAVRNVLLEENCSIKLWQTEPNNLAVQCSQLDVYAMFECKIGEWTLCTDQWLIDKVFNARKEKLSNETGGVLVGSFDMQRKIVYVVDTIPSPPDSKEWPTVYIRGCQGLIKRMSEVKRLTAGMLEYVGEWHSHPEGCGCNPSIDDKKAFAWLVENMITDGLPALMLIVGDDYAWYLGQMP